MYKPLRCPSYEDVACQETDKALQEAIRGEAAAIKFYTYLIELTPDQVQRDLIFGIREDEKRHLNNFQAVYCRLTGCTYSYPEPDVDQPHSYCQGLAKAFNDEQEAYEFYKANYFCNKRHLVKKAFLDALLDEAEHARWFNNLLIRNGCFQDP
ncbi:MAG TPA: hypothetical protein PLE01_07675 [Syntrophothermus lipocalidus]|nr:hypothetical protein [Syntrophothermus lipocalidus]